MITIDDQTLFVIYGCGEVGSIVFSRLDKMQKKVLAGLDKNCSGDDVIKGLNIYLFGTEPAWDNIKKKIVVIICLADGMLHKAVADSLFAHGYEHIVFLPLRNNVNSNVKDKLTQKYNWFISDGDSLDGITIDSYLEYKDIRVDIDDSIIKDEGSRFICWVRPEILFTESYKDWQGDKSKVFDGIDNKDKNILSDTAYESMFDYFSNKSNEVSKYFDRLNEKPNAETVKKTLYKREDQYRLFKQEIERGMDFFIESAPDVFWNARKYMNLIGGHHRTTFLISESRNLIPVRLKKTDYQEWCNEGVYKELLDFISKNNIVRTYAPIPHPGMLFFPSEAEQYGNTRLKSIYRFLRDYAICGDSILDISHTEGYYARCFERIGYKECFCVFENEKDRQLVDIINRLLYRDGVKLCLEEEILEKKSFDVIVGGMNRIDRFSLKEQLLVIKKYGMMTNRCLIWETEEECLEEKVKDINLFERSRTIYKEYSKGKIKSVIVFQKE